MRVKHRPSAWPASLFNQGLSNPQRSRAPRLTSPNRWPIAPEGDMDRQYGSVVRQAAVLGGTSKSAAMRPPRKTAMQPRRKMVWIERPDFEGWSCSECAWLFNPSDPPAGPSFEEMKQQFEAQRDKEFDLHVCAAHPKVQTAKAK
jgi:rubredoxin